MAPFEHSARIAVAAILIASSCSLANAKSLSAKEPPREGCRAVSKIEYGSAKKQYLLQNRFGGYVRTGRIGRRFYWYCHH
jgi:hypothetical protein